MFDTIIVGGGPSGLSAALVLGRCLRNVLVCDAGNPRNARARVFNGFLSRDASDPGEFLQIGRDQLQRYETVELRKTTVVHIKRSRECFTADLVDGQQIRSRTVLLATGLIDELPKIDGFEEFYGESIHSCPLCDAWEHRGEPLAVLGGKQEAAELAIEMLLWNKDVVLCADGTLECDDKTKGQLAAGGIQVIDTPVARLEGEGGKLRHIRFTDGTSLARSVLYFAAAQYQKTPLAKELGCEFCDKDGCIQCDENGETSVPDLYAAGNCSRGVQMVIAAAAEGALAAVAINNHLLEADVVSLKDQRR
jgi:thioredoxin reductase